MTKEFLLIFSLFALVIGPAAAAPPVPASETPLGPSKVKRVFDITRDGGKIGTNSVEIEKQGDATTVKFTTHLSVVVMFVEAYRYDYTATETWNGSQLVSFKSQTNDNGTKHALSVTATAAGDKLGVEVDGKRSEVPHTVLPATYWSKAFLSTTQMFDEADGKRLSIKVADLGDESVTLNGAKHQVRHYQITGDRARDLWFEGDTLVRLKLAGTDGSKIVSDLRP
jgi:hypothetical protein